MSRTRRMLRRGAVSVATRALRVAPMRKMWDFLAQVHREARTAPQTSLNPDIPEIGPIVPRADDTKLRRLNLLVPTVSRKHVFGGIQTALLICAALRQHFDQVRIISTDDSTADCHPDSYYAGWPVVGLDQPPPACDHIVTAGARYGQTLAVGARDIFLATAWWTAHNSFALIDWQKRTFAEAAEHKLLYIVQDFEPGFYPWSSRYALAEATYRRPEETIAIINSRFLAEYLTQQGYDFPHSCVLHPRLNPEIAKIWSQSSTFSKERIILAYGRPGVERNAFSIIVGALRNWVANTPGATEWRILAAGEDFPDIDLGRGCRLSCVGKLELEEYAQLLKKTAIGLSLMISPHPSYPPLELAAFGARVVTNRFSNKDLSLISSFITTVDPLSSESLAAALSERVREFESSAENEHLIERTSVDISDDFLAVEKWEAVWPEAIMSLLPPLDTPQ